MNYSWNLAIESDSWNVRELHKKSHLQAGCRSLVFNSWRKWPTSPSSHKSIHSTFSRSVSVLHTSSQKSSLSTFLVSSTLTTTWQALYKKLLNYSQPWELKVEAKQLSSFLPSLVAINSFLPFDVPLTQQKIVIESSAVYFSIAAPLKLNVNGCLPI